MNHFFNFSQRLGSNSSWVQAGGGNTSIKVDAGRMHVKASGWRLRDANVMAGFVCVNGQPVRDYYRRAAQAQDGNETQANQLILDSAEPGARPSMETGFHALMDTIVLHSHPVLSNILCCACEGPALFEELCREHGLSWRWVPYARPGHELTLAIARQLRDAPLVDPVGVWFLQNHGIIVSAARVDTAWQAHEKALELTRQFLQTKFSKMIDDRWVADLDPWRYLQARPEYITPDQIVFCAGSLPDPTPDASEVASSIVTVLENQKKLGLTPQYLTENDARALLQMESEKHRQIVARQQKDR